MTSLAKFGIGAVVVVAAACVPSGIFLACWFNNGWLLLLCLPGVIFLS